MASFRSTRLEAVLGAAIDAALPYAALVALKTNQVTEATDLDYKREHYKNNDPKRALCGDIAAMANAAGGVILLGIAEDTRTSAAEDLVNVALGDDQIRRIRSIAASGIAPLPSFEVFPIADPADPGNGIIVIAVPQSPMRPHAVLVNDGFRFPVRNGTGTLYLTEAQVADAYRRRARRLDEGVAALERLERHMLDQMHGQDIVYVAVTLMPDVPGYFQLDAARFRAFRQEVTGCPAILDSNFYWERHRVASGRLIASGGTEEKPRYLGCELYQDGSGSFATAVALADQPPPGRPEGRVYVLDERVVDAIWSGARFLARHARDRAAVGGKRRCTGHRVTCQPRPSRPALPPASSRVSGQHRIRGGGTSRSRRRLRHR